VGQEYFINSQELQNKVANLLPSQGGAGAGIDLSASTQIVPIIDLTESAQGSNLRQDLQSAFSLKNTNAVLKNVTNTTVISNTGYWRVYYNISSRTNASDKNMQLNIYDGATSKVILSAGHVGAGNTTTLNIENSVIIYLTAGESLRATVNDECSLNISVRQIADINGELTNP
tara:strand:+ start:312 stop:830 length:519 start_codon:yes stop_codon:yes gene_type:complete